MPSLIKPLKHIRNNKVKQIKEQYSLVITVNIQGLIDKLAKYLDEFLQGKNTEISFSQGNIHAGAKTYPNACQTEN